MKIIQSPTIQSEYKYKNKIFLAGGISSCPNWQDDIVKKFIKSKEKDTVIFNPRRIGDLAKDTDDVKQQIMWEHIHLMEATHILFWFPEETVCPITLFELGKYTTKYIAFKGNLFVGIHPNYSRKFDLEIQLPLINPAINIVYTLNDLYDQVMKGIN